MNRIIGFITLGILTMMVCILPAAAEDQDTNEHYSATIAALGGAAGSATAPIDIYIEKFSTDEEAVSLALLLAEKGQDALSREMEKLDAGRVSIASRSMGPIAVARSIEGNGGRTIRVFMARNIAFLEHFHLTRSRDYPFSIIEMQVNEKGEWQGVAIAAAKIKFNDKEKQFVVESMGQSSNLRLMNVRKW
ncbi:MAG: hypothetical protein P8Z37_05895 [Acidobacteriota bacterium]